MDKLISRIAYIYIALPFIIFALGFMRWYIGIPAVAVAIYGLVSMWKDADAFEIKVKDANDRLILIIALVITLAWVLLAGIGNICWQNSDHLWRNAIFKVLVDYDWPAINSNGRALTYYIGFWLPAALFGKVFGLGAGFIFQIIWALVGVYLVYLYMCEYFKKISLLPFIIFIFFSGLDTLGAHLPDLFTHSINYIPFQLNIESWAGTNATVFLYSSNTTQLFWVFNQCIYTWLLLLVILKSKTNKYLVFLMGLLFINSVFGFMGLIPILLYRLFTKKEMFSIYNFVCGGVTGILTFIFYLGNNATSKPSSSDLPASLEVNTAFPIYLYFVFVLLEVLVYVALSFPYNKKNPLFYITSVWLLICPIVRFGGSIDFCMRASIPCLLLLTLFVIDALQKSIRDSRFVLSILIVTTLLIGSMTALREISRTILYTSLDEPHYFGSESNVFDEIYFSCDADTTFFFNYIGK